MSEQIKFGDRLFLRGESVFFDNGLNDAVIESRNGTLVIKGNLVVEGTTTTVNSIETVFADPFITLNADYVGSASQDVGIEVNRGDDPIVRFLWDETNDRWSFEDKDIFSTGNINANVVFATLNGNIQSDNGVIIIDSTGDGSVDIRAGNIDNTVIGSTTSAAGYFTTITGDGTDITNVLTNYTTDDLTEGTSNLYYTDERVDDRFNSLFSSGYSLESTYDDTLGAYILNFEAQNIGSGSEIYDTSNVTMASFKTISAGNISNGGNGDLIVSSTANEIIIDTASKINQLYYNTFVGNGATSIYTLPYAVTQSWHVILYIDGVVQTPDVAYTISSSTITLASPLALNSVMNVLRLATTSTVTTTTNAELLDSQLPSYYLDYTNFSNTPTNLMVNDANNSVSGNISPSSDNTYELGNTSNRWKTVHSYNNDVVGKVVSERFETDATYDAGTVVVLGGTNEITASSIQNDTAVIGIISSDDGLLMNSNAGTQTTHPSIVLSGRATCKVYGTVNKGDLLVTSDQAGYAMASSSPSVGTVIGKALESQATGFGTIEILVSLM